MSVLKRSFAPRHFLDLIADYCYLFYDEAATTNERKQTRQQLSFNNVPRVFMYDLPLLLSEALVSKRHTLRSIFVIVSTESVVQTVQSNQFLGLDYKVLTDADMLRVIKNCEYFTDELRAKTATRIGTLSEIMLHRLKHVTLIWAAKFGSVGTKNFYTNPAINNLLDPQRVSLDAVKKVISEYVNIFANYHDSIVSSLAIIAEHSGYAPTIAHTSSTGPSVSGPGNDALRPLSQILSTIASSLQHVLSSWHQQVVQHVTEISAQSQKHISTNNQNFQMNVLSLINQVLNTTVGGGWPMLSLHIQDFDRHFAPKNIDATMEYNNSGISNSVVLLHYFADRQATVYEPVTLSLDLCDDPTNAWFYINEVRPMYSLQVDSSPCGRLLIRGDYTSQTSCILQDKYLLSGSTDLATTYRQYEAYIAKAVHALSQLLVSAWKHSLRAQKLILEEVESLKNGRVCTNLDTFRHIIAGHTINIDSPNDPNSEVPGSNGAAANPFINPELPSNSLAYVLHHTTFVISFADLILLLVIRIKSPSPDSIFNLTLRNIGGPNAPIVTGPVQNTSGTSQPSAAQAGKMSYAYMRRLYITQSDMDNYITTITYLATLPYVILNEFLDYMSYLNQKTCQENFSKYRQAVVLTEKMSQFCAQNGLSESVVLYIQKILDADCRNMVEDFILGNQVALNSVSWHLDNIIDGFIESYLSYAESTISDEKRASKNIFGGGAPSGVVITTSGLTRLYTYRFLHLLRQDMTPRPGADHDATSIMDFDEQILLSKSPYYKVQPSIALYTQSPDCPSLNDDIISIKPLSNAITYQLFIPVSGRNRTTFEQLISLADFMSLVARFNPFPHRNFTHTLIFNTSLGLNNLFYPYHLKGAITNDYQHLEHSVCSNSGNSRATENAQGTILAHFLTTHVPAMSQFSPTLVNGGGGPRGTCSAASKANFAILIDFYNNVNLTYNLTYNSLNREKYNRVRVEEDRTGGECAVCNVKYDNYKAHISSAEHLKNYKSYMAQVSGITDNGESNAMIDELRYLSLQFERISAIGVQLSTIITTIAAELGCTYEFVAEIVNDLLKSLCGDLVVDVSDIPRAISPNCKTTAYLKWREDSAQRRQLSFEQFLTGSGSRKTGYKRIKASAGSLLLTGIMLDVNRIKWVRNSIMARCCGMDIHTYTDALAHGKDSGVATSVSGASSTNKTSINNNGSYYLFPRLPSEQEYTIPKLIIDPRTHTQFLFEEEDFTQLIRVSMATVLWRAYGGSNQNDSTGQTTSTNAAAGTAANTEKQRTKNQQSNTEQAKFGSHTISLNKTDYVTPTHIQTKSTNYMATYESDCELDLQQEHVVRRLCDETPFLSGSRYIHATAELKYRRYERYRARISCNKQEAHEEDPNQSMSAFGVDYDAANNQFGTNPDLNLGLSSGSPTIKQRTCYHVSPITGLDFKLLRQDIIDVEVGHIPQTGMLVKLAKNILEIKEQRTISDAELVEMAKAVFNNNELDEVFTVATLEWLRERLENPAALQHKAKDTASAACQQDEEGADEETSNELNTYDARLSGTSRLQIPRLYWYDHANGRMFVDGFNDLEHDFIQQSHNPPSFDIGRVNAIEFSRAYAKSIEKSLLSGQSEITFVERNTDGVLVDRNAYESTDHTLLSGLMGGLSAHSTLDQPSRTGKTANSSAASRHHSALGGASVTGGNTLTGDYSAAPNRTNTVQKSAFNYNANIQKILTAIPAAKVDTSLLSALAAIPLDILRAIFTNCINLMQASDVIFAINNLNEVINVLPEAVTTAISKSLDTELHCFAILNESENASKIFADRIAVYGRSKRATLAVEGAISTYGLSGAGAAPGFVEDTIRNNSSTGRNMTAAELADIALDAYFESVAQQAYMARSSSCQDFFSYMRELPAYNASNNAAENANRYPSNSILKFARANSVAAPRRIRLEQDMISIQLLSDEISEVIPATSTQMLPVSSLIGDSNFSSHLITTGDPKNLIRYSSLKESTILDRGIETEDNMTYISVNGQQVLMVSHYAAPIMSNFNAIDPGTAYFSTKKHYGNMIPISESICSAVYSSLVPSYTGTSRFLEQVSDLWKGSADAFLGSCASVSSVYNDQTYYSIKILDPSTTTLISLAARAEVLRRKAGLNAPGFNETKGLVELRHDCRSLWRSTGAKPIVVLDKSDKKEFLGILGLSDSDGEDADFDEVSALGPFDITQSGKPDIYATHTYQFMN